MCCCTLRQANIQIGTKGVINIYNYGTILRGQQVIKQTYESQLNLKQISAISEQKLLKWKSELQAKQFQAKIKRLQAQNKHLKEQNNNLIKEKQQNDQLIKIGLAAIERQTNQNSGRAQKYFNNNKNQKQNIIQYTLNTSKKTSTIKIQDQAEQLIFQAQDSNGLNNVTKNNKIDAATWADKEYFDYEQLKFSQNTISTNSGVYIFGSQALGNHYRLTISINVNVNSRKVEQWIWLGIADPDYKSKSVLVVGRQINCMYCDGSRYSDGYKRIEISKARKFRDEQRMTVVVDIPAKMIMWKRDQIIIVHKNFAQLADDRIKWVPFIFLGAKCSVDLCEQTR